MPIFEFRCVQCGHQFEELLLGRVQASDVHCPKCLRPGVERLLSVCSGVRSSMKSGSASTGSGCGGASSRFS